MSKKSKSKRARPKRARAGGTSQSPIWNRKLPKEAYEEDLRVTFCAQAVIMAATAANEKRENEAMDVVNALGPLLNKNQRRTVITKAKAYLKAKGLGWDGVFPHQEQVRP